MDCVIADGHVEAAKGGRAEGDALQVHRGLPAGGEGAGGAAGGEAPGQSEGGAGEAGRVGARTEAARVQRCCGETGGDSAGAAEAAGSPGTGGAVPEVQGGALRWAGAPLHLRPPPVQGVPPIPGQLLLHLRSQVLILSLSHLLTQVQQPEPAGHHRRHQHNQGVQQKGLYGPLQPLRAKHAQMPDSCGDWLQSRGPV